MSTKIVQHAEGAVEETNVLALDVHCTQCTLAHLFRLMADITDALHRHPSAEKRARAVFLLQTLSRFAAEYATLVQRELNAGRNDNG